MRQVRSMQRLQWAPVLVLAAAAPTLADVHLVPNPNGPLAGRTIVFSPGHGRMLDGTTWRFQRGVLHEIREDIHTNEIFIEYVQRYLVNAGARVESVRERSFQRHEAIVQNGGAGYSETGAWSSSTSAPNFYGADYRWTMVSAQPTATAEFRPTLPAAGRYPVYVWYTHSANRARDARFVVHHTGGQTAVKVDQQLPGDHWTFLGEFHFDAGSAGRVVLTNEGSDATKVVIADAVRFGGGVGQSGLDRWQEAAKEFLAHKGFQSTWGDVTVRPGYGTWLAGGDTSRWRADHLYVSLHSNASGGSGTARGVSTFSYSNGRTPSWGTAGAVTYPTSPSPLTAQSDALRDALHGAILEAVRAEFLPSWPDRGRHVMNFGELRESRNMPSALIELGFHDNADDAALLRDARYRAVTGRAIYKGIVRYWAPNAAIIPLPPEDLALENLGSGELRVSWRSVSDPLEPSASASAFKVYTSPNGRGFDDGVVVAGTSATLSGLPAGASVFVRVAALNAGGESLPSRVAGARVGAPGDAILIVDGFQRAYRHTEANIAGRYTYDYTIEHLEALAQVAPGVAIDCAGNEAVVSGRVRLADYALVDWLLGRESTLDRTFDPTEQTLVDAYLQSGGALLATGTEIGWDLEARAGGQRFLREVLGVQYLADDAGVRVVRSAPTSALQLAGILQLHDGTTGRYDAASPDVLAPSTAAGLTASSALSYEAAGAPSAGVVQTAPFKVVVLGFPLESVIDLGQRAAIASQSADLLVPAGFGPPAASAPTPGPTPAPGGTAPVTTGATTAPGSTAAPQQTAPRRGGSSRGCTIASDPAGAPGLPAALLLLFLGLAAVGRRSAARG